MNGTSDVAGIAHLGKDSADAAGRRAFLVDDVEDWQRHGRRL